MCNRLICFVKSIEQSRFARVVCKSCRNSKEKDEKASDKSKKSVNEKLLLELGFTRHGDLWFKHLGEVTIYHDYRTGSRQSYAYEGDKPFKAFRDLPEYTKVKLAEEGLKCKKLTEIDKAGGNS